MVDYKVAEIVVPVMRFLVGEGEKQTSIHLLTVYVEAAVGMNDVE
jgi:hypothetical protein